MIIFGWLLFAGGYTLVYYGVSMWNYYTQKNVPKKGAKGLEGYDPDGIPLGVLLGLSKASPLGQERHAVPPFNLGGTIYGQTTSATNQPQQPGTTLL